MSNGGDVSAAQHVQVLNNDVDAREETGSVDSEDSENR